jgi:hypothetical protein
LILNLMAQQVMVYIPEEGNWHYKDVQKWQSMFNTRTLH